VAKGKTEGSEEEEAKGKRTAREGGIRWRTREVLGTGGERKLNKRRGGRREEEGVGKR